MKKSLTVLSFLLALVMCFSVVGCGGNDDGDNKEPETETVSFTQPEITMDEWDTVKLGASSSKGSAITLTVSDPSVLYLKGINLTALKAGTATVTAALKNQPSVTAVLTVNINENAAKRPVLAVTGKKSLGIGDTAEYSATINGGAANATFAVDKTDIAAIDSASGKMTAKKVGTVKITATAVYCGVTFNGEYSVGVNPQVIFKNDVSDLKVNVKDEIYDGFDEGYFAFFYARENGNKLIRRCVFNFAEHNIQRLRFDRKKHVFGIFRKKSIVKRGKNAVFYKIFGERLAFLAYYYIFAGKLFRFQKPFYYRRCHETATDYTEFKFLFHFYTFSLDLAPFLLYNIYAFRGVAQR